MPKKDIHWDDKGKKFNRDTGEKHTFKVRAYCAYVLDVEDINFHFDSAVFLADNGAFEGLTREDERVTGLSVLRTALKWAKDHPEDKLLIAGHTDRSGSDAYNLKLSRRRARNVFSVLTGDWKEWVKISKGHHQVEDYQQILKWINAIWKWDCDPGPKTNSKNAQTTEATKKFQKKYSEQDWGEETPDTGKVDEKTWKAFFRVYERVLMFICEVDDGGLKTLRNGIHYVRDDRKWVGCGEFHPITPERTVASAAEKKAYERNVTDRRVELMFFREEERVEDGKKLIFRLPPLDCHPSETECKPEICWLYNTIVYRYIPIEPDKIPPLQETWVIKVLEAGTGKIDERKPVKDTDWEVTGSGAPTEPVKGKTDGSGVLRVRVYKDPCTMKLKIKGATFTLDGGLLQEIETGDPASHDRLSNMLYGSKDSSEWADADAKAATKQFQEVHEVGDKQGTLDGPTKDKLKQLYGS